MSLGRDSRLGSLHRLAHLVQSVQGAVHLLEGNVGREDCLWPVERSRLPKSLLENCSGSRNGGPSPDPSKKMWIRARISERERKKMG